MDCFAQDNKVNSSRRLIRSRGGSPSRLWMGSAKVSALGDNPSVGTTLPSWPLVDTRQIISRACPPFNLLSRRCCRDRHGRPTRAARCSIVAVCHHPPDGRHSSEIRCQGSWKLLSTQRKGGSRRRVLSENGSMAGRCRCVDGGQRGIRRHHSIVREYRLAGSATQSLPDEVTENWNGTDTLGKIGCPILCPLILTG